MTATTERNTKMSTNAGRTYTETTTIAALKRRFIWTDPDAATQKHYQLADTDSVTATLLGSAFGTYLLDFEPTAN